MKVCVTINPAKGVYTAITTEPAQLSEEDRVNRVAVPILWYAHNSVVNLLSEVADRVGWRSCGYLDTDHVNPVTELWREG